MFLRRRAGASCLCFRGGKKDSARSPPASQRLHRGSSRSTRTSRRCRLHPPQWPERRRTTEGSIRMINPLANAVFFSALPSSGNGGHALGVLHQLDTSQNAFSADLADNPVLTQSLQLSEPGTLRCDAPEVELVLDNFVDHRNAPPRRREDCPRTCARGQTWMSASGGPQNAWAMSKPRGEGRDHGRPQWNR